MRLIVVNLTRFGDLLQTQPTLAGLAAQGHETALVCLDNFASATELMQGVAHVAPLPGAHLLAGLDGDWRNATADLTAWCARLRRDFNADGVLNLTATLAGRLLARLLLPAGGSLRGFALDAHGFGMDADAWCTFLQAASRDRGSSPFNLVDVMRLVGGVGDTPATFMLRTPEPERLTTMRLRLERAAPAGARGFVAFQPGASEDRRRWPLASFVELGDRLWQEERLCPVLLGSAGERPLAERYLATSAAPCVDLVGATSLPDLAAALSCTCALVTNDTGTMHLAAGLGLPVLAIFLATAQPWDTGPYHTDNCCLEPDMPCHPCPFGTPCPNELACRHAVRPAGVFQLLRDRLRSGRWAPVPVQGARVWASRRDTAGLMDLTSLSGHDTDDRTLWIREQRHFYRQFLDQPRTHPASPLSFSQVSPPLPAARALSPVARAEAAATLAQAAALLHLMGEQGTLLEHNASDLVKQRFLTTCGRIHSLFEHSGRFRVLGHLWLSEVQAAGASLDAVLRLTRLYHGFITAWHAHLAAEEPCSERT